MVQFMRFISNYQSLIARFCSLRVLEDQGWEGVVIAIGEEDGIGHRRLQPIVLVVE